MIKVGDKFKEKGSTSGVMGTYYICEEILENGSVVGINYEDGGMADNYDVDQIEVVK